MDEYYKNLNETLLKLKEEFYIYHKKKDFSIIAITYHNIERQNTWHLIDIDYIERFKDKQLTLKFGNFKVEAYKYPYYTKLVYHEDKNKKFLLTPEKEKDLIKKNIDISNLKLLAERTRLAQFGEIWNIKDDKLASIYRDQLLTLKINNSYFNAFDYREKVFLVKNNLTNEKFLCNVKGQVIMKK